MLLMIEMIVEFDRILASFVSLSQIFIEIDCWIKKKAFVYADENMRER